MNVDTKRKRVIAVKNMTCEKKTHDNGFVNKRRISFPFFSSTKLCRERKQEITLGGNLEENFMEVKTLGGNGKANVTVFATCPLWSRTNKNKDVNLSTMVTNNLE